jgi:hypothetical protein
MCLQRTALDMPKTIYFLILEWVSFSAILSFRHIVAFVINKYMAGKIKYDPSLFLDLFVSLFFIIVISYIFILKFNIV